MAMHLDRDTLWVVLRRVLRPRLLELRLVCTEWKCAIDERKQHEWRQVFEERVVRVAPCVRDGFDWKRAMVRAAMNQESVIAVCLWDDDPRCVRVVPPWSAATDGLRAGVVRGAGNVLYVDFWYDGVFRLRCLKRSCHMRNVSLSERCLNCRTRHKRRCLSPQYEYYMRPLHDADTSVAFEALLLRLSLHT